MSERARECYILTISGRKAVIEDTVRKFTDPGDTAEEIAALREEITRYIHEKVYAIARKHLIESKGQSEYPPAGARF